MQGFHGKKEAMEQREVGGRGGYDANYPNLVQNLEANVEGQTRNTLMFRTRSENPLNKRSVCVSVNLTLHSLGCGGGWGVVEGWGQWSRVVLGGVTLSISLQNFAREHKSEHMMRGMAKETNMSTHTFAVVMVSQVN